MWRTLVTPSLTARADKMSQALVAGGGLADAVQRGDVDEAGVRPGDPTLKLEVSVLRRALRPRSFSIATWRA